MLLLCEGELPRLNPALPGELPLLLMLLTEGEGDQPPRAGELPLAEGEDPRRNVLVGGPPVTAFEAINGRLPRVPVLARLPGEELTVDALVSVGEELFTAPTALAAVAMVALVAELDLDIDGELDRMGRRGEPDDFVVDVDLGEDEPLELYDAVVGLGLFDEVLNAGRGLLDVEIGSGRGLFDVLALDLSGLSLSLLMGLAFRLGATTAAGSTTLGVLCYNGMKIKVLERGVLPEWSQACRSVVYRDEEEKLEKEKQVCNIVMKRFLTIRLHSCCHQVPAHCLQCLLALKLRTQKVSSTRRMARSVDISTIQYIFFPSSGLPSRSCGFTLCF